LYQGKVGTIDDLLPDQEVLPSGISAPSARVRLAEGEFAVIPWSIWKY
jgi:hypothetical protein